MQVSELMENWVKGRKKFHLSHPVFIYYGLLLSDNHPKNRELLLLQLD